MSAGGCRRAIGSCENRDFISQGESRRISVIVIVVTFRPWGLGPLLLLSLLPL